MAVWLVVLATAATALYAAQGKGTRELDELLNPLLGPRYSLWLAGPISYMVTEEERQQYLALTDDAAAKAFIEEFWKHRDPEPDYPENPLREEFEKRSEQADRLYSEAGYPGRRTDRGTIYVLYGEPEDEEFEVSRRRGQAPIEVWTYPEDAEEGLDGRQPNRRYRFSREGDLTVFYRGVPTSLERLPQRPRRPY